jgi:nicotinamide-nucleotide amidase
MSSFENLSEILLQKGWKLVTAESCTGGMIAAGCTDRAGSSLWFERGFVSYSNEAKQDMLGVDRRLITSFGAVSEEVARAMAVGALKHSRAQVSLAVTGVAGPTGGSSNKPVGTVWFAWAIPGDSGPSLDAETAWVRSECVHFQGDRAAVRNATVNHSLRVLIEFLRK